MTRSPSAAVERLGRLRRPLERLAAARGTQARLSADPLELARRYADPRDQEVAGLLASSLAYGRVDLFKPKVEALLDGLGPQPGRAVADLDVPAAARLLRGFVYRFNVGADVAVLLLGAGALVRAHGSLEGAFVTGLEGRSWRGALTAFAAGIVAAAPRRAIVAALGQPRALQHLLPVGGGAAKRLSLFLRWMVRADDGVDLGAWTRVSAARLVVPLDTHLARVAKNLGLTRRKDLSWRTAEEITAALRQVDPDDPVRFDFALCHLGMSQACPRVPSVEACRRCPLLDGCASGARRVARALVAVKGKTR